MSDSAADFSPATRVAVGLFAVAMGLFPMLAAFDVGPLGRGDINGPPWLGFVAGGIFVLAGLWLLAGPRANDHPLGYLLVFVLLAGFAAMGNWIAFGAGPRACSVGVTGFFFISTPAATELVCRGAFGVGALMLDGMLVWMATSGLRRLVGPGPWSDRLESVGKGVLLVSLLPILIPLLLLMLPKVLFDGLREYFKTGRWPRNEAFIARMKKRGAL